MRPAPLDSGVVDLDGHDLEPGPGEDLGDPGTHRAEPDHADLEELSRHDRSLLLRMEPSLALTAV